MTTTRATEATDPLATGAPEAGGASYTKTTSARRTWRSVRGPVAIAALLLITAIALVVYRGRVRVGEYDPDSVESRGSRAIAQLLKDNGRSVDRLAGLPATLPPATVFVPFPEDLPGARLQGLLNPPSGVDVVVIAPGGSFTALGVHVSASGGRSLQVREPACEFAAAVTAGTADVAGRRYDVDASEGATVYRCYPAGGRPGLVRVERDDASVTIVGTGDAFTNDRLDEEGNAALALGLLDRGKPIAWVMHGAPGAASAGDGQSLVDLLPDGVLLGLLQLVIATGVAMFWRGRRLGPVVMEQLPVVVRAAEAVEGRGRLYAAGKARGRAGWNLRRGARDRLRTRLGLPPDAGDNSLVSAAAERSGRDPDAVGRLLYGPDPVDDAALVRLAAGLDHLDSEVRRS